MEIRKLFKFSNSHIVRNCSSQRCKKTLHSHEYHCEVFYSANDLDNGQMIVDFGLFKQTIKPLFNSFNNTIIVWNKDKELVKLAKRDYRRYIIIPFSPSAESLSVFFLWFINKLNKQIKWNNNEKLPYITKVRVDETRTGYALSDLSDLRLVEYNINEIESNINEFNNLLNIIKINKIIELPKPERQI